MSPDPYNNYYTERPQYYAHSASPYHTSVEPVDFYVEQVVMQVGAGVVYTSAAVLLVQLLLTVSEYFTRPYYMCDYSRRYEVFDWFLYSVPYYLHRNVVRPVENLIAQGDAKEMIKGRVGPMTDIVLNAIEEVATKWENPGP